MMKQTLYAKDETRFWIMEMNRGECLPLHIHPPERQHNTVCIAGAILIHGIDGAWPKILRPGEVFYFPPNEYHTIIAVEPNTIFMQLFLTPSKFQPTEADADWMKGRESPTPIVILEQYEPFLKVI